MARNVTQTRAAIQRAIKKLGGPRKVSGVIDISEQGIKLWLKIGHLNDTKCVNVYRFARAAGEPIESFIIVEE